MREIKSIDSDVDVDVLTAPFLDDGIPPGHEGQSVLGRIIRLDDWSGEDDNQRHVP